MPLFICEKCGTIENTATGWYWWPSIEGQPVLCSECHKGKWHGHFEKRKYTDLSQEEFEKMELMNAEKFKGHYKNTK